MKERLVELLRKDNCCIDYDCNTCKTSIKYCYPHNTADKILADGWIRPPYKIGAKVYVPINSLSLPIPNAVYECEIQRYGLVTGGLVPIVKLKKGSVTYGDIQTSLDKLFPSREEAEAKLKEGGEG
jgi:hypothetical protein